MTRKNFIRSKWFLLLVFLAPAFISCMKEKEDREEYVEVGDPLPSFSAVGEDGVYYSSSAEGKITLICFFITTCPDCHRELPKVQKVWEAFGEDPDFEAVAIGRGHTLGEISDFWEEFDFTMPYYCDPQREVYERFATVTVPRIYISDRNRIVRYKWVNYLGMDADDLTNIFRDLIENP